ncbi:DUF4411 family protein [Cupriavidus plantarum]|uniref:DUF4411 family protein n=1 Tax=Cupriavidus plantarum TaxID=942865 RepID=UPI0015CC2296|nr:DUF4411 family protein [Cupriavidus plantarum]NYI02779.1 hypothetical protein [Cupriavidus plantarum]
MKLYLLDANVLITANREYYSMEMVPVFWEWLLHMAAQGRVKMPIETLEEVRDGQGKVKKDLLVNWLNRADVYEALLLKEEVDPAIVAQVIDKGYAPDLDETELEEVGRDPFLIAYAAADVRTRVVVSIEVSAPAKRRANRRVPDVCRDNDVAVCNTFTMLRELGFTTAWIKPPV